MTEVANHSLASLYESAEDTDPSLDYCLWTYEPPAALKGKDRSYNLLLNSWEAAGIPGDSTALNQRIRNALGQFRTVWGVKFLKGELKWEYYFYDYRRLARESSIEAVLSAVAPYCNCDLNYSGTHPYFMFSIDFDRAHLCEGKPIESLNVYIGNVGSAVSSGISYLLRDEGLELGNTYYFFDRATQWEDIVAKVVCSAFATLPDFPVADVLWPELCDCKTIVVANKRQNDSVYFSRISLEQLRFFLDKMNYPEHIQGYVAQNRSQLDHLLFDVGIDYVMENDQIKITKSGYYGVF